MHIELVKPTAALAPYIRFFYRVSFVEISVETIQRVGLGQIRFFLSGGGTVRFADQHSERSDDILVIAPARATRRYIGHGPADSFGAVLRPLGWATIMRLDARKNGNRLIAGREILGDEALPLLDWLRTIKNSLAMRDAVEDALAARIRSLPPSHLALIEAVTRWEASPQPRIEDLYADMGMGPRQAARLLNHYYGGPAKFLERKIRATRAATRLARGEDPTAVAELFYDQPHMIRELKRFVGHTPKSLRDNSDSPFVRALAAEGLPDEQSS